MRNLIHEAISPATIAEFVALALFFACVAVWAAVIGG